MRFDFEGKTYQITFSRERREVMTHLGEVALSDRPYTTALLDEVVEDPAHPGRWNPVDPAVHYRMAVVGCWRKEKRPSQNKGRVRALRLITKTIPADMVPLMWKAYNERAAARQGRDEKETRSDPI